MPTFFHKVHPISNTVVSSNSSIQGPSRTAPEEDIPTVVSINAAFDLESLLKEGCSIDRAPASPAAECSNGPMVTEEFGVVESLFSLSPVSSGEEVLEIGSFSLPALGTPYPHDVSCSLALKL